jgi:hypothetical protein
MNSTKHRLLDGNPFHVNPVACRQVADAIRSYHHASDLSISHPGDPERYFAFKLALAAVCHGINWDFLQEKLAALLLEVPPECIAERLSRIRSSELDACLADYPKRERIQASSRAQMLRDLGRTIVDQFAGRAINVLRQSTGRIFGENGFLSQLDKFESYSADPLRKKSHVLIQELARERIVRFQDENEIQPAIDYHIQRLYLRTDRVVCSSLELENDLRSYRFITRGRFVKLLRIEVSEALKLTAFYSRLSVPDVNYVEWQIARGICLRRRPFCTRPHLPQKMDPEITRLFTGNCPFVAFCPAFRNPNLLKLKEPRFTTSHY